MKIKSPRRGSQAFTLIELLVVIGIIAVLLALLMPTTQAMVERAREVTCASNQKQLVLACINYTGDNDGKLPNNKEWVKFDPYTWITLSYVTNGTLFSYVKDSKVYLCPTFFRNVNRMQPKAVLSYSMNFRSDLKYKGTNPNPDGGLNNVETLSSVRRPAGCVFIAEENPPYAPWHPAIINGKKMVVSPINDGRLCWANLAEYWDKAGVRDAPGTYHRNKSAKAAFFDGHSETFIMDEQFKWKYKMEPLAP